MTTKLKLNNLLEQMKPGLSSSGKGCCVKEAIRRGYLNIKGEPEDLKKMVFKLLVVTDKDLKEDYDRHMDVTLEMLLNQPNQAGSDYYIPGNATKRIFEKWTEQVLLTGLCGGNASIYKDTRHCVEESCGDRGTYGTCIKTTEKHCKKCNRHYDEEQLCLCEQVEEEDDDEEVFEEEQEEEEESDYCYMGSDSSSSYDSDKHHMYFMGACLHDNDGPPLSSSSSQSLPSSPISSLSSSIKESSVSSSSSWSTVSSWYTISPSVSSSSLLSSTASIPNLE